MSTNNIKKNKSNNKLENTLTKHVVTSWYRAYEITLLQQERDTLYAIDIWSIGCTFAELSQMKYKNCCNYKIKCYI